MSRRCIRWAWALVALIPACESMCGPGGDACGDDSAPTPTDAGPCAHDSTGDSSGCGGGCVYGGGNHGAISPATGRGCCGNAEVDFSSDRSNCGACGAECPSGNTCRAGVCQLGSCFRQALCGSAGWTCLDHDVTHCGYCDMQCGISFNCVAGACVEWWHDAGPRDAGTDAGRRDAGTDAGPTLIRMDAGTDAGTRERVDAGPPFVPTAVRAELVFSGPSRVSTPPTWNPHLPKLVADGRRFYAIHAHMTGDVASRFASIVRRDRVAASAAWEEVAHISYPGEPPGIAMDLHSHLHVVMVCQRPGSVPVECYPGAGTGPLESRYHHLQFSSLDGAGALRFDSHLDRDEWTEPSNGHLGIGVTPPYAGVFWSLADASGGRVVQYEVPFRMGTATLSRPDGILLFPLHAFRDRWFLYADVYDSMIGPDATYLGSVLYAGSDLAEVAHVVPAVPTVRPLQATASDVAFDIDGTPLVVAWSRLDADHCTQLLRFDDGISAPPTVRSLGCVESEARLQVSSAGTLYVLTVTGDGPRFRIGLSGDRGDSWVWQDLPIEGIPPDSGDVRFFGATPITSSNAPRGYDADVMRFLFSGADAAGMAQHTYLGEISLTDRGG